MGFLQLIYCITNKNVSYKISGRELLGIYLVVAKTIILFLNLKHAIAAAIIIFSDIQSPLTCIFQGSGFICCFIGHNILREWNIAILTLHVCFHKFEMKRFRQKINIH